jgi:hypothetical protein
MSPNLLEFDDIYLEAMARVRKWQSEYETQFIAKAADELVAQVLRSMSPGQREVLRGLAPEAYESLVKRLKVR